ncbi:MAG: dUTP diphosphatase [Candidatus Nanopelagicales bacterium]
MNYGLVDVLITRVQAGARLPAYAHAGDAGADLHTTVGCVLAPSERALLPTGVAIALPSGYAAFVHPRSGLAVRYGVSLVNAPGTVDAGYRGEIQVSVINLDPRESVTFEAGDRIAQLVIQRVERARFHEVERLPGSDRGAGGFGSTGVNDAGGAQRNRGDDDHQPGVSVGASASEGE